MASDFWKMYSERKKKRQTAGNDFWKMYNDRKWSNHGEEIARNLSDRVNTWFENSGNTITESNNRYANRDSAFYVTDSADWLTSVTDRKKKLDAERDSIRSILGIYSPYLDSDWVKQINSAFDTESRTLSDVVNNATLDHDFWSSLTKEEYESAYDSQTYGKKYEGKTYAEIQDALKQSTSDREKTWLSANADSFMTSADAQAEIDKLNSEKKKPFLGGIFNVYSYDEMQDDEARKARIEELEVIKNNAKKQEELDYFNSKLPEATEYANQISRYLYTNAPQPDLPGYKSDGPVAKKKGGTEEFDENFEEQLKALNQGSILNKGIFHDMFSYVDSMTEEEKDIYNYVYVTEGEDKAFEYYKLIEEDLKNRVGKETADFVKNQSGVNKALLSGAFSIAGGADSAVSGFSQLFSKEKVSSSGLQVASQELSKDLTGVEKILYQAGYTVGNMLPMMLVSSSLSAAGAPARIAELTGAGTLGASAGGNAYGQAISEGYSEDQARDYGILVGASEAGLQYLLGGIGKLGGVTDEVLLSKISTIDNTLARLTLTGAVKIGSEITEEELQNYLEPAFRTIIFNEEYDAPDAKELIETAIVTALSTGMLEGADIVLDDAKLSGEKGKSDFSVNEQKVFDSLYSQRIAEAEKEGKLSAKEKREIRDRLSEEMKKGYIGTDAIESVLGGENYTAYKNSSEKENSLKAKKAELSEEIEALLDKTNPTMRDSERLGEARKQLREVEQALQNSDTGMLKQKLADEMSKLTGNDTYLKASYNERAKRSQSFEADLSKYNEKQRATVQKAIESGFLNNTGRTHEFVDVIAKISADKGISFDFTNNAKLKDSGFAVEGKTVNGYVTKDGITINMDSPKAWQSTVGHEVTHILEGSELYTELQAALFEYAETKGEYQSRLDTVTKLYENVEGVDIDSELTSELVGEYLFTDADFVSSLSVEHRNVFQRIYDEIKYLCKMVTAGSREARTLEKVKKAFDKAYREIGKKTDVGENGTDTVRYSLTGKTKEGIEVYETSQSIMDMSWNERKAKYLDVMKNEYRGRTAKFKRNGHTYYAEFDHDSIRKPIYGDKRSSESGKKALIKAGADGDVFSLVENSQYYGSKKNTKDHTDADYFDYFVKTVQIDGKLFDLVADVEKKYGGDGGYVYTLALRDNKKVKASPTHGSNPVHSVGNTLSNNSISQSDSVVNSQDAQNSEKNSLSWNEDYLPIEEGDIAPVGKNAVPARELKMEEGDVSQVKRNVEAEKQLFDILSDDNFSYYHAGKILEDPTLKSAFENATGIDLTALAHIGNKNFLKSIIVASREEGIFAVEESVNTIRKRDKAVSEKKQAIKTVWALRHDRSIADITKVIRSPFLSQTFEEIYNVKLSGSNSNKRKQIETALNNGKRISNSQIDSLIRSVGSRVYSGETADMINVENFNSFSGENLPNRSDIKENDGKITEDLPGAETEDGLYRSVSERVQEKIKQLEAEVESNRRLKAQSEADFDREIAELQAEYDGKKNKNTKEANRLLRRMERVRRLKDGAQSDYEHRISRLESRIENANRPEYRRAEQRKAKSEKRQGILSKLVGDTTYWRDKKLGLSYKLNTLKRNLRDIVRGADGKADIEWADRIWDFLQGAYNRHEAELKLESEKIKKPFFDMKINRYESEYIQILGELTYNPKTTLTREIVDAYYEKHKSNLDVKKVNKAIKEARRIYEELYHRINAVLREEGMKELGYIEGYFPHFNNTKQGLLGKLLNWKTTDNEIPTDIAGLTEQFKPKKSWQSFDKHRTGDSTEYNFLKGFDTYVHGALDWIYHIEDIQNRRELENYIRYIHSDEGVQAKIDAVRNDPELDADEVQERIDAIYGEAQNPLGNFLIDLRSGTNTLAGKKSSMDRGMEYATRRKIYSTMTNINSRISANMIAGSISSALTNLIPFTQSWSQVSPVSTLVGLAELVRNQVKSDGIAEKSVYLTNRYHEEQLLNRTGWDKVSSALGFFQNTIDKITGETIWRSKYHENIKAGMSENEAIKNADAFAEGVMAGRSRGNMPTAFDAKNPVAKLFTSFQLEVANQYAYMFKDMPQDIGKENLGKLTSGYIKMFVGAYLFNTVFSTITGRDAAFDPIGILEELLRDLLGDDEEEEPDITGAAGNLIENVLENTPFVGGLLGGGRVPISSALPYELDYKELLEDIDGMSGDQNSQKYTKHFWSELLKPLTYVVSPMGGGQIRKTVQGLSMFTGDKEVTGSYTDSGNLRFPVEPTASNVLQAALFGQYASENAREYFDNGYAPLTPKQTEEYAALGVPIEEYREIRTGLTEAGKTTDKNGYVKYTDGEGSIYWYDKETGTVFDEDYRKSNVSVLDLEKASATAQKTEYIASLPLSDEQKDILYGNAVPRSLTDEYGYQKYTDSGGSVYWYDKNSDILYDSEYNEVSLEEIDELSPVENPSLAGYNQYADFEEFDYSIKNPGKYTLSRVITDNFSDYQEYTDALKNIKSDYDGQGNAVSGSRKKKVWAYINGLDLDYGQKLLLFKSEYKSDSTYDFTLLSYLGDREDISYEDLMRILETLGLEKYRTYYEN